MEGHPPAGVARSARRAAAVAAAGAGVALALAGCGTETIDEADAEKKVAALVQRVSGAKQVDVDCPGGVDVKKGESFTCKTSLGGSPVQLRIELVDDDGRFRLAGIERPRP